MKKRSCLILFLMANLFLFGQDFTFKVKIKQVEKEKGYSIKNDKKLNSISQKYKDKGWVQCYPNAKNPKLSLYFSIKGSGQKDFFKKELLDYGKFDTIVEEKMCYAESCNNPVASVNDEWIAQNWANNYALNLIEANCAWSISQGSSNIHVGIADTEFETTHDDLENKIDIINGQSSGNHEHGTFVSGLASAETNNNIGVAGIGYNTQINAHRIVHSVDNSGGAGANPVEIRAAIWDLYQDGAPIINVSWTGTGLDFEAAEEITENGTVLVLAAGNLPNATNHSAIANIPGVIIVSSVDGDNNHGATNHAHNQWVDICAPGINVSTTITQNTYGGCWGTSCAAPIVSGTIGLMLEVNPCLTPSNIEDIIEQSADPVADASSFIGLIGAGRLNAYKAVMAAGTRDYDNMFMSGYQDLNAGYGFNLNNISIGSNSNINLDARKEVNINGTFDIPIGSTFSIDIGSTIQTNCQ